MSTAADFTGERRLWKQLLSCVHGQKKRHGARPPFPRLLTPGHKWFAAPPIVTRSWPRPHDWPRLHFTLTGRWETTSLPGFFFGGGDAFANKQRSSCRAGCLHTQPRLRPTAPSAGGRRPYCSSVSRQGALQCSVDIHHDVFIWLLLLLCRPNLVYVVCFFYLYSCAWFHQLVTERKNLRLWDFIFVFP